MEWAGELLKPTVYIWIRKADELQIQQDFYFIPLSCHYLQFGMSKIVEQDLASFYVSNDYCDIA